QQTLVGHVQDITSVAVSKDPNTPLVVSASEDCTVRIWSLTDSHAVVVQHPAPVLAVACTPPGSESNLCLSGASDGKGRLWKLDGKIGELALELQGQHDGAITSVAFSPDGKVCVTGGDDREICLWDTATGALRYHFPAGHRNAVTSLRFTPRSQLVSAGHDNTLRLWTVGE